MNQLLDNHIYWQMYGNLWENKNFISISHKPPHRRFASAPVAWWSVDVSLATPEPSVRREVAAGAEPLGQQRIRAYGESKRADF